MHPAMHKSLLIVLFMLLVSYQARAQRTQDFTRVLKSECLNFPKLPEIGQLVQDIHYKITSRGYCDDDFDRCWDSLTIELNYRYQQVKNFEHYAWDGRLITTSQERVSLKIDESIGETARGSWTKEHYDRTIPQSPVAIQQRDQLLEKLRAQVERKIAFRIYDSAHGPCRDSHYQ
jgi:hypothetical protein